MEEQKSSLWEKISSFFKTIFGIGLALLIFYGIFSGSGSGSSYGGYEDYDYEDTSIDRSDAISDYWDEIVEYLDGTYTIEACADSSGNCYDVDADISSGTIETLYFSNGGYISIYGADVDSDGEASGSDDGNEYWNFEVDSSDIDTAFDDWADNQEFEIDY